MNKQKSYSILKNLLPVLLFSLVCLPFFPQKASAEPKAFEYILPDSDSRYLTDSEIVEMPPQVVCYGKNEIYAKHGRMFRSEELTNYFEEQVWYLGTVSPDSFSDSVFNSYESANIQKLSQREKELSPNEYILDQPGYSFDPVYEYAYGYGGFDILSNLTSEYDGDIEVLTTDYFTLRIPAYIELSILQYDPSSFEIVYDKAYDSGYGGHVVSVIAYDWADNSYSEFPDWIICGLSADKKYVALYPTDVQFDPSDSQQAAEYSELMEYFSHMDYESELGDNIFKTIE